MYCLLPGRSKNRNKATFSFLASSVFLFFFANPFVVSRFSVSPFCRSADDDDDSQRHFSLYVYISSLPLQKYAKASVVHSCNNVPFAHSEKGGRHEGDGPKGNKKSRLIEVAKRGVFPNLEKGLSSFLFYYILETELDFSAFFFSRSDNIGAGCVGVATALF